MALELTVMSLDFETEESTRTKQYDKVELRIGRGSDNDVILSGSEVSVSHALISLDAGSSDPIIYVTDLGSTNGTFVDNKRLEANEPIALQANQRILIGEYLVKPAAIAKLVSRAARAAGSNEDPSVEEAAQRPNIKIIQGGRIIEQEVTPTEAVEPEKTRALDDLSDLFQSDGESGADVPEVFTADDDSEPEIFDLDVPVTRQEEEGDSEEETDGEENAALEVAEDAKVCRVQGVVGAGSQGLDLVAKKLVALVGTVLHKGQPLGGVSIEAGEIGTVITDDDGNFEISGIVEGTSFELELSRDDFIFDGEAFVGTVEEGSELVFHATELFSVSGQIVHRGVPLAGVTIDGGSLGTTLTNAAGRYEFTRVPEGTEFTITASRDGYVFETA